MRRALLVSVALAGLWAAPAHASTFCGTPAPTERSPNVIAGRPVHVIYAIPSDGEDRIAGYGTQLQTDAETIDGWWRGQDATRTPRFDLFPYPCGAQLDISDARLPNGSGELIPADGRFSRIQTSLFNLGFTSVYGKYLVYYDGPADQANLCGQASGVPDRGPSFAIVYLRSCSAVATAAIAAHELLHSLGAVPVGAPHRCPDSGHVCDTNQDLMYPFIFAGPLRQLLDPGRDDYYGHSGSWWDVQDSLWLRHLDAPQVRLSLTVSGGGRVASDVPGLDCTASCDTDWDAGAAISLSPTPADGMRFVRWGGACSGAFACPLALSSSVGASALFAPATFRLAVSVVGKGTVRSSVGAIVCGPRCAADVASYEPVRLTAKPAKGWRLKAWTGACGGRRLVCTVPMTGDARARAVFARR